MTRRVPPPIQTAAPAAPEPGLQPATSGALGIRAVAQMTGIDEHTLRIWERRYGFPQPVRSSGGARLYSTADVHALKLIAQALSRGHRPGEVVALGVSALQSLLQMSLPTTTAPEPAGEIDGILAALKREDVATVRGELRQLAMMLGPRRFVVDIAHPVAVRVGELWATGDLEVHQEHLMSECLSTQLRLLRSFFDDSQGPVVLLATLPDEPHGLPLEMVALYVATAGAAPRVIGVNTPADQLLRAARAHHAAVVGLSIMPSSNLSAASEAIATITAALPRGTQLWVGGGGAPLVALPDHARSIATWIQLDAALSTLLPA